MARLVAAYAELSTRRPYSVAFASCTFKGMLADAFSQRVVEGRSEQDWKRTGVFAFYGGWYCGWFQHALYNVGYASLFGLETTVYNAARKVAFDSAFHIPLACFCVAIKYSSRLQTLSTQPLRLCFENSMRAIDPSKNQPNRLRFD